MRLKADLSLLFASILWGFGFIAQRTGAADVGALIYNAARWSLGALIMLPFVRFKLPLTRQTIPWMGLGGIILFAASGLQQGGLATTTAGNAGFITGAYVILIPILLALFWKEKTSKIIWISVLITAAGIYLLSMSGPLKFNRGDGLVLLGSVMWALHVIITGNAVKHMDVLPFVAGQYIVCGLLNLISGLIWQADSIPNLLPNWLGLVYLAVFSTGIGFTLQAYGQRHAPAADAAIIMSMEAVFSAVFGWMLLAEKLDLMQLVGCGLILVAIILSQVVTVHKNNQLEVPVKIVGIDKNI
jgi:drug/metabolite transporter (DMT)-like permease